MHMRNEALGARTRAPWTPIARVAVLGFALAAGGCKMLVGSPTPVVHPVQRFPSGMTLQDLVVTQGQAAREGDSVEVHYVAQLPSGTTIDSTRDRGLPVTFALGAHQTLRGLEEGVVGMRVAGSRRLVLPPDLAYGPGGNPPLIPPETPIVIEVELLRIVASSAN
jgi:FKBP-type peptidyl-prolyl cis-trans isomerase